MQTQEKENNKFSFKLKKSHICLFGSLLVILGFFIISYNHIVKLKMDLFSEMKLSFIEEKNIEEVIDHLPNALELSNDEIKPEESQPEENNNQTQEINYNKYLGVLEIPRIGLKRGFYGTDSRYNNISYNVTLVGGSTMPDVERGNLILMAHSGDAYISFFAFLYRLNIGNYAYVTYNGNRYKYEIVNIYNIPKNGTATINRNKEKTTMTLITCTKDSNTEQTVYILEQV